MGYGHWNDGYYMHDGMGWGGWVLMTVLFLLLVAVLVVGLLLLLRAWRPGGSGPGPSAGPGPGAEHGGGSPADRILDERFARGEIDEEEYHRRREALRTP